MCRVAVGVVLAVALAGPAAAMESTFQGLRLGSQPGTDLSSDGYGLRVGLSSRATLPPAYDVSRWGGAAAAEVARTQSLGLGSWASGLPGMAPFADPLEAGAIVDYRLHSLTLSSSLRQGLGARGTSVDVGASYGFSLAPRHTLALLGSLGLGNHDVMQAFTTPDADLLRIRPPGLGFRDVGARLSLLYSFDTTWYVNTTLGYSRLLGDPAEVGTPDRSVTSVGAFFGYRF